MASIENWPQLIADPLHKGAQAQAAPPNGGAGPNLGFRDWGLTP